MIKNYVIIGCGGIGFRLAEPLLRMLLPVPGAQLFLVDGKDVRHKNLSRQHGSASVGLNKAVAVARSLEALVPDSGVKIVPVEHYLEEEFINQHDRWLKLDEMVVFAGVDNKPSRVFIEDAIQQHVSGECVLISGGNDEDSGQAVLTRFKRRKPLDPLPSEIDPDLLIYDDGRMPSKIPCDEATESEPQLPIANMGAAWCMLSLWYSQIVLTPEREDRRFTHARFDATTPEVFPSTRTAMSHA